MHSNDKWDRAQIKGGDLTKMHCYGHGCDRGGGEVKDYITAAISQRAEGSDNQIKGYSWRRYSSAVCLYVEESP